MAEFSRKKRFFKYRDKYCKKFLSRDFARKCAYCKIREGDLAGPDSFEKDHFLPVSHVRHDVECGRNSGGRAYRGGMRAGITASDCRDADAGDEGAKKLFCAVIYGLVCRRGIGKAVLSYSSINDIARKEQERGQPGNDCGSRDERGSDLKGNADQSVCPGTCGLFCG